MLKNKKKLCAILSVFSVFMILSACSPKKDTQKVQDSKKEKTILVGTSGEYYPSCFKKNGELQGFEIDVWKEISKRTGYKVEFKVAKFSGLFGMLDSEKIDVIAHQTTKTAERAKKYDFSDVYAYTGKQFEVKKDSKLNNLQDFKGKKVGVTLGGNSEKVLRDINKQNNLNLEIAVYDGNPLEQDVLNGRLDACFQNVTKAQATIEQNNLDLKLTGKVLYYDELRYPFTRKEENKEVLKNVNKAINDMKNDGTMSKLSEKWYKFDITKKQ